MTVPVYKPFAVVPRVSYELRALDCCPQTLGTAADIGPVKECIIKRILGKIRAGRAKDHEPIFAISAGDACYNREILKNLRRIRRDVGILAHARAKAKQNAPPRKPARHEQHK